MNISFERLIETELAGDTELPTPRPLFPVFELSFVEHFCTLDSIYLPQTILCGLVLRSTISEPISGARTSAVIKLRQHAGHSLIGRAQQI